MEAVQCLAAFRKEGLQLMWQDSLTHWCHTQTQSWKERLWYENPSLSQSPSTQYSPFLPKGPTHRGAWGQGHCPATPPCTHQHKRVREWMSGSMVAPSPWLLEVMEPPWSLEGLRPQKVVRSKSRSTFTQGIAPSPESLVWSLNRTWTPTFHSPTGMQGYQLLLSSLFPFPTPPSSTQGL